MNIEELEKLADLANLKGITEITFGEAGQIYSIKFSGKGVLPNDVGEAQTLPPVPPSESNANPSVVALSDYDNAMARILAQAVEME